MRKIRLSIEDLAVESFPTADGQGEKAGTVRGHVDTYMEGCPSVSGCATCAVGGCPRQTMTCFQGCYMTNGYDVCREP